MYTWDDNAKQLVPRKTAEKFISYSGKPTVLTAKEEDKENQELFRAGIEIYNQELEALKNKDSEKK